MASFEEALLAGEEQNIELQFADGTVIDKRYIAASGGFRYEQIFNRNGDLQMGSAVMASVEVTLLNTNGIFYDFDFTQEFSVVYKAGGSVLVLGQFKGDRTDRVRSRKIVLAANDRMTLFDRDASEFLASVQYPITLADFYISLCGYVGIGYYSGSDGVVDVPVNGDMIIDSDPFGSDSYTCRQILGWIAEAACAYAFITGVGQVRLKWFETEYYYENFEYKEYTIKKSDRFELIRSEVPVPKIDRLEVYTSYSDRLNTAGSGSNVYVIADNPLLFAENDADVDRLQPYVNNIYAKLNAFPEYYPGSVRALSWPAIDGADIIHVTDDDGTSLVFPVFAQTLTWSGRGKTEYENTGNPKRETVSVQQRELENLKKRMVSKADLKTEINSYLNSETGEAAISSVVSGKYVEAVSTVYSTPDGIQYGFEKDDEGFYVSTNSQIRGTFAYGKFTFRSTSPKSVLFRCINYGPIGKMFGIISKINTELEKSRTIDSEDKVLFSYQNVPNATWKDIRVDVPAGESFITIKYYKDSITTAMGDCFKIKPVNDVATSADLANYVKTTELSAGIKTYINTEDGKTEIETITKGLYVTQDTLNGYLTKTEVESSITQAISESEAKMVLSVSHNSNTASITLKQGEESVGTIDLSGYVTFTRLSTAGSTTINGSNITTGTISAELIDTTSLRVRNIYGQENTDNADITIFKTNGRNIAIGNYSANSGVPTNVTFWNNQVVFAAREYGNNYPALVINPVAKGDVIEVNGSTTVTATENFSIYPYPSIKGYNAKYRWTLGTQSYPFDEVCLNYGVALWDDDNGRWTSLEVKNGSLVWYPDYDKTNYKTIV